MNYFVLAALVVGLDHLTLRVLGPRWGLLEAACLLCAIIRVGVIEASVHFLVAKFEALFRRLGEWLFGVAILACPFYVPLLMPGGLWVRLGTLFGAEIG
jgi:hypothetical protein